MHTDYPNATFRFDEMRARLIAQAKALGCASVDVTYRYLHGDTYSSGYMLSLSWQETGQTMRHHYAFFTEYEGACMIEKTLGGTIR